MTENILRFDGEKQSKWSVGGLCEYFISERRSGSRQGEGKGRPCGCEWLKS